MRRRWNVRGLLVKTTTYGFSFFPVAKRIIERFIDFSSRLGTLVSFRLTEETYFSRESIFHRFSDSTAS